MKWIVGMWGNRLQLEKCLSPFSNSGSVSAATAFGIGMSEKSYDTCALIVYVDQAHAAIPLFYLYLL